MTSPNATGTKAAVSPRASRINARQRVSLGLGLVSLAAMGILPATSGCLNRPIEPVEPRTTSTVIEKITQSGVDKIDIVLMIDNSSSMADKQQILADAVPDLVDRLVNPNCVGTMDPTMVQSPGPANSQAMCNTGFKREFKPIDDINIGIVDSSLGGMGSDACPDNLAGFFNNDKGHLVSRSSGNTPTYMNQGFLAWDPGGARTPPGISDSMTLETSLQSLVTGVGEKGCGYEQQLEGVTRFLVVPKPYDSLSKGSGGIPPVTPMGEDTELEKERADFLRPDSLLAVIVLTDENDFSINWLGPQNYAPWNSSPFYRASANCASNPGDKCCYSCGLGAPSGCPADPTCSTNSGYWTALEDSVNLKESQPKKHYGFDPNFPVLRYVNAFSKVSIDPTRADLSVSDPKKAVPNPIFTDLSGQGKSARDPGLVFFAAIVGVPYQAIARDPTDLGKGFKNFDELSAAPSGMGSDFWTQYVGDPDHYIPPMNPIMQESTAPRGVTGATQPNGGDRSLNTMAPSDIQYACIFPLKTPNPTGIDCSGKPDSVDNPLCTGAAQGMAGEPQINAKAYPGIRELAVVHGLAGQGIAASICPQNVTDKSQKNYGYRPAVGAIIDRLKTVLGGQCLPRQLHADAQGNVPCLVLEASHSANGQGSCTMPLGRQPVSADHQAAITAAKADPQAPMAPNEWNNFCEIVQFPAGVSRQTCQNTVDAMLPSSGVDGWCYIDAASTPAVGNPAIVASCPANDQRLIRFVGQGAVQTGATAFITCSGDTAQ